MHAYTCTAAAVTYRENGSFRVLFAAFSAILRETNRGLSQFRNQSAKRDKHPDDHKLLLEAFASLDATVDVSFFFGILRGIPATSRSLNRMRFKIVDCGRETCESARCFFVGHYGGRISSGWRERATAMQARALSGATLATLKPHSHRMCGDMFAEQHPRVRSVFRFRFDVSAMQTHITRSSGRPEIHAFAICRSHDGVDALAKTARENRSRFTHLQWIS